MARHYIPETGDIVWLHFDTQAAHEKAGYEQAGHHPALVLSPATYNAKTGLMLCCPLATQIKGYPFEVLIDGQRLSAALADQVKSLDWRIRKAVRKGKVSEQVLSEVRLKIAALVGFV